MVQGPSTLANAVRVDTATTGTGTITLGNASSDSFLDFIEAGVSDDTITTYLIEDDTDFELGRGLYEADYSTLTRDTVIVSKIGGTAGTSKLNLSGSAKVRIVAITSDFMPHFGDTAPATPHTWWIRTTDFAVFVYYQGSTPPGQAGVYVQVAGGGGGFPNVWYDNVDANTYNLTDVGDLRVGTAAASDWVNGAGQTVTPSVQINGLDYADSTCGVSRWVNSSNSGYLMLAKSRGGTIGDYSIVADGDALGRISFAGSDGTNFAAAAEIRCLVDGTPGNDDMPGRMAFFTTADGASSATERIRIPSTGGISFDSGTNALDDYEEGTWTPVLSTSGTDFTSVTYNNTYRTGHYVKVGNVVHFWGGMSTTALTKGSASGNTTITGLPYTSSSGTGGGRSPSVTISANSGWVQSPDNGTVQINNTLFTLNNKDTHNSATSDNAVADVTAGSGNFLYFSGSYDTS